MLKIINRPFKNIDRVKTPSTSRFKQKFSHFGIKKIKTKFDLFKHIQRFGKCKYHYTMFTFDIILFNT